MAHGVVRVGAGIAVGLFNPIVLCGSRPFNPEMAVGREQAVQGI